MKIENQVCTLQQAKRLKELGILQQSAFLWLRMAALVEQQPDKSFKTLTKPSEPWVDFVTEQDGFKDEVLAVAFTVAELLQTMTHKVHPKDRGNNHALRVYMFNNDDYTVSYHTTFEAPVKEFNNISLAQACADMLIWTLENNLTTAEDCNKRLSA